MRELKFRIWDEEENEWLCESDDDALTYYGFSLLGECMMVQSPRKWTVKGVIEQYTGLKDKNGKEIYEGDILGGIWEGGYIAWCDKCKQLQYHISSNECMACLGDVKWYELVEDDGKLEVIGNIHENKELLGGNE